MNHARAFRSPGFTIVELLIVIVVIGILAVIGIVSYNGVQQRAATASMQSDLHHAETAMEEANKQLGAYPSSLPATFSGSPNVTLTLKLASEAETYDYCISASHVKYSSLKWSLTAGQKIQSGTCL